MSKLIIIFLQLGNRYTDYLYTDWLFLLDHFDYVKSIYICYMDFMQIVQPLVHYSLHFLAPGLIAYFFYPKRWKFVWLIFVLTMLVDVDHLLADPIFDPNRCSVGFHLLHSYIAIAIYFIVFVFAKRGTVVHMLSVGLLFHMLTDFIDCQLGHL